MLQLMDIKIFTILKTNATTDEYKNIHNFTLFFYRYHVHPGKPHVQISEGVGYRR